MSDLKTLSSIQKTEILETLKVRFQQNMARHEGIDWQNVAIKLEANNNKLWSLSKMELTGGEPDIIGFDEKTNEYLFVDCAADSPVGRRSICYDELALEARKENKPKGSAIGMATEMGIEILNEADYRKLQMFGKFDVKTSSWIKTPENIRKLGGALFADFRFETVFIYHNGVQSYYAGREFRGKLLV